MEAYRFWDFEDLTNDGVASPTRKLRSTPQKYVLALIYVRDRISTWAIVWLEELGKR
jgi:hypothetical protein